MNVFPLTTSIRATEKEDFSDSQTVASSKGSAQLYCRPPEPACPELGVALPIGLGHTAFYIHDKA